MNKYEKLLYDWSVNILDSQIKDRRNEMFGGLNCRACAHLHGRADNGVFPLAYEYVRTGEKRFLDGAKALLVFRENFMHPDGSVQNDFESEWKGITVFSAICLYKTLYYFEKSLPEDFVNTVETYFKSSAEWVHDNIKIGFRANINYYAASAAVNAFYSKRYNNDGYAQSAKEMLSYCMSNFTENGILGGEGQPHGCRTEKGCMAVDIGYNAEESLPCLVDAAETLGDGEALNRLIKYSENMLEFLLPDGAWDNSFGVRNNKWTYYGSRTSDGSLAMFTKLGKYDRSFLSAAQKVFSALESCTVRGRLYGGRDYEKLGQPDCIHHVFCHAVSLAEALLCGLGDAETTHTAAENGNTAFKYYPEIDTYKISAGKYLATVTAYDYSTYTYTNGAAHSSGGALSLLYKTGVGPVIAGSVYEYRLTEKNNMQNVAGDVMCSSLIPRAEYEKNGEKYATCLDGNAKMQIETGDSSITVRAVSGFVRVSDKSAEDASLRANSEYVFSDDGVAVTISVNEEKSGLSFILPVVTGSAEIETGNSFTVRRVFFPSGGFEADEYTFPINGNGEIKVTIK